jgi:RNA polymerase sigma factor (sigma-70 family)
MEYLRSYRGAPENGPPSPDQSRERKPYDNGQAPGACSRWLAIAINTLPTVTPSGGPEPPAADTNPIMMLPSTKTDAGSALAALYRMHYRPLVRLAALLVQDIDAAEALVQDSFVATHSAWRRLADTDRALAYLHQTVVTRSRSALRHRIAAGKGPATLTEVEHPALFSALRTLAPRQREALVLTYYADLPQAQIASAMRISKGAVKRHTLQAMSSLRAELLKIN